MTIVNQTNITKAVNITCETSDLKNLNSPSIEFWERYVLQITSDISETGEMRYDLLVCLLLAWILVYLCLCKGIKTSGKVWLSLNINFNDPYSNCRFKARQALGTK